MILIVDVGILFIRWRRGVRQWCQSINEKRTERFLPGDDLICTLVLRYPCEVGGEVR